MHGGHELGGRCKPTPSQLVQSLERAGALSCLHELRRARPLLAGGKGSPLGGADTWKPPRTTRVAGSAEARRLSSSGCWDAVSSRARPGGGAPPPRGLWAHAARLTLRLEERLDAAIQRAYARDRGAGGASCSSHCCICVLPATCSGSCSSVSRMPCSVVAHAAQGGGRGGTRRAVLWAAAHRTWAEGRRVLARGTR